MAERVVVLLAGDEAQDRSAVEWALDRACDAAEASLVLLYCAPNDRRGASSPKKSGPNDTLALPYLDSLRLTCDKFKRHQVSTTTKVRLIDNVAPGVVEELQAARATMLVATRAPSFLKRTQTLFGRSKLGVKLSHVAKHRPDFCALVVLGPGGALVCQEDARGGGHKNHQLEGVCQLCFCSSEQFTRAMLSPEHSASSSPREQPYRSSGGDAAGCDSPPSSSSNSSTGGRSSGDLTGSAYRLTTFRKALSADMDEAGGPKDELWFSMRQSIDVRETSMRHSIEVRETSELDHGDGGAGAGLRASGLMSLQEEDDSVLGKNPSGTARPGPLPPRSAKSALPLQRSSSVPLQW
eukprot:SM000097S24797  [mRNA]  locus=s97:350194:352522:+ [translate_table: standard]